MKLVRAVWPRILLLILAGCSRSSERQAATVTVTQTDTGVLPTAATAPPTDCLWKWNTQPLPELSAQVQAALVAAGVTSATASAVAFGENCVDRQTGQVKYFASMQTDFYVALAVGHEVNLVALGDQAEKVLGILDGFPPGSTPGTQPGHIGLTFVAGEDRRNLWFNVQKWVDARNRGLHGEALLEALGYPPTSSPTSLETAQATGTPLSTYAAVPTARLFSVSIAPAEQTFPAGASISFFVSVPEGSYLSWPSPQWSVTCLPPGAVSEFLSNAVPTNSTLMIHTSCATPPGSYVVEVQATISETVRSTKAALSIADRLTDSQPGAFTGSFVENTVFVRRGGPSTMEYGPFLVVQFCADVPSRKLRVIVQSATSEAGTPLGEAPRFSLFHSLVWPAPDSIQTASGGYKANALEVAQNDGWALEWDVGDGVYMLVFQRSPFEDAYPPEKRPASVMYTVETVR